MSETNDKGKPTWIEPADPIPRTANYGVFVVRGADGYHAEIVDRDSGDRWKSRPFASAAAAWRTLLRELMRRQGLL